MAPVRRYLRITKYSVLECRIYLDNPALAASWLLHPRDPVLPRVIDAVRPLVLPKLREEKERESARKKSAKRRQIKDVVAADDFEVSVFLTDTPTRHSLLAKHKRFRDDKPPRIASNAARLIAEASAAPLDVDLPAQLRQEPVVIREESDDEDAVAALAAIPAADEAPATRTAKRRRAASHTGVPDDDEFASTSDDDEEDDDGLFVDDHPDEPEAPPSKRRRQEGAADALAVEAEAADDDKKKMAMDVSFEGFAIYGRVLCLVVKRRETAARAAARTAAGARAGAAATAAGAAPGGQATMENWISSTQMPNPGAEIEGDE